MALTKCRECDAQVSTEATSCPHCGVPRPASHLTEVGRVPTSSARAIGFTALMVVVAACAVYLNWGVRKPETSRPAAAPKIVSPNEPAKPNAETAPTIPEADLTHSQRPVASAVINEITTSKGKFPIIDLPSKSQSAKINSYIVKEIFGKTYNTSNIRSMIEVTGWDESNYANFASIGYRVKRNTSSQLIIEISSCVRGAHENCSVCEFTINPITGHRAKRYL